MAPSGWTYVNTLVLYDEESGSPWYPYDEGLMSIRGSKVQGSAQPPAKRTAGQIEKETEVSYEGSQGSKVFQRVTFMPPIRD
jgi:hypothetical protein